MKRVFFVFSLLFFGAGGLYSVSGQRLFVRTLGGSNNDYGYSLIPDLSRDGGYVVAGRTVSFGAGLYDLVLCKFDSGGNSFIGSFVSPTITSLTPIITSPIPIITSPTPTITSPNPTITSPSPTITTVCASGVEENQISNLELRIAKLKPTPNPFTSFATISGYEKEKFFCL